MSEESIAVALYDYKAHEKEELSIKKNDKLVIVDDSQTWWKVRNEQNVEGYVPSNYVGRKDNVKKTKIKKFFSKGEKKKSQSDSNGYDQNDTNQYCTPEAIMAPTQKALCIVRAKFNYQPMHTDELPLKKGDLIHVLEKEKDGWWKGFSALKQGWFPSNYADEQISDDSDVPLFKVVTLYQFKSINPEEMNFEKGELLEIIKQPEGDPDWWQARKSDGTKGLVPKNYVKATTDEPSSPTGPAPTSPVPRNVPTSPVPRNVPTSPVHKTISEEAPFKKGSSAPGNITYQRKILPSHQELPFVKQKWFWGRISRSEGEKCLLNHGRDGDFLIRESETKEGDYSISLKAPDRIKHFRVQTQSNKHFKIGQRTFVTLDELIEHYKKAPIFTNENGEKMYLIKAIDL